MNITLVFVNAGRLSPLPPREINFEEGCQTSSTQDAAHGPIQKADAHVKFLGTIITSAMAFFACLSAVVRYCDSAWTAPVAGYTVNDFRELHPDEKANGEKAVAPKGHRVLAYEVWNPGPGDVDGIELRLTLRHPFDETKQRPSRGLVFKAIGSGKIVHTSNGQDSLCQLTVVPGVGDHLGYLKRRGRFGVFLWVDTDNPYYFPDEVKVFTANGGEFDATKPLMVASLELNHILEYVLYACLVSVSILAIVFHFYSRRINQQALKEALDAVARSKGDESSIAEFLALISQNDPMSIDVHKTERIKQFLARHGDSPQRRIGSI